MTAEIRYLAALAGVNNECRSLDSLRSLGMTRASPGTTCRSHEMTGQAIRALGRIAVVWHDWAAFGHAPTPAPGQAHSRVGRGLCTRGATRPGVRSDGRLRHPRLAADGDRARGDPPARQSRSRPASSSARSSRTCSPAPRWRWRWASASATRARRSSARTSFEECRTSASPSSASAASSRSSCGRRWRAHDQRHDRCRESLRRRHRAPVTDSRHMARVVGRRHGGLLLITPLILVWAPRRARGGARHGLERWRSSLRSSSSVR